MVVVAGTAGVAGAPIGATVASFFSVTTTSGPLASATVAGGASATAALSGAAAGAGAAATGGASVLASGATTAAVAAGELTMAGAVGTNAAIGVTALANPVGLVLGVAMLGATVSGEESGSALSVDVVDDPGSPKQPRLARTVTMQKLQQSGVIRADCWKQIVRDTSETPSNGKLLQDLLDEHPSVKVREMNNTLVLENEWGETFRLLMVQLPGSMHKFALHVEAFPFPEVSVPVEAGAAVDAADATSHYD